MSQLQLTPFNRNAELQLAFDSTTMGVDVQRRDSYTISGGFVVTHDFSGSMPIPTALGIFLISLDAEGEAVDPEFDIDAIGREDLKYFGFNADGYATDTITVNVDDGGGTVDLVFTAHLNLATGELDALHLSLADGSYETNVMEPEPKAETDVPPLEGLLFGLFGAISAGIDMLKHSDLDIPDDAVLLQLNGVVALPPGTPEETVIALKAKVKQAIEAVLVEAFPDAPTPETSGGGTSGEGGEPAVLVTTAQSVEAGLKDMLDLAAATEATPTPVTLSGEDGGGSPVEEVAGNAEPTDGIVAEGDNAAPAAETN